MIGPKWEGRATWKAELSEAQRGPDESTFGRGLAELGLPILGRNSLYAA